MYAVMRFLLLARGGVLTIFLTASQLPSAIRLSQASSCAFASFRSASVRDASELSAAEAPSGMAASAAAERHDRRDSDAIGVSRMQQHVLQQARKRAATDAHARGMWEAARGCSAGRAPASRSLGKKKARKCP